MTIKKFEHAWQLIIDHHNQKEGDVYMQNGIHQLAQGKIYYSPTIKWEQNESLCTDLSALSTQKDSMKGKLVAMPWKSAHVM